MGKAVRGKVRERCVAGKVLPTADEKETCLALASWFGDLDRLASAWAEQRKQLVGVVWPKEFVQLTLGIEAELRRDVTKCGIDRVEDRLPKYW